MRTEPCVSCMGEGIEHDSEDGRACFICKGRGRLSWEEIARYGLADRYTPLPSDGLTPADRVRGAIG